MGYCVFGQRGWTRPTDFSSASNQNGSAVDVESGTVNIASRWLLSGTSTITVDVSPQTWVMVAGGEMNAYTLEGNNTNAVGAARDLTIQQVQAMLNSTTIGLTVAASKGYNLN